MTLKKLASWNLVNTLLIVAILLGGAAWNTTFESEPADTDPVAQGDNRIREDKLEVRNRAETELCFGTGFTGSATNCVAADDGRLREGAAKVFVQDAAPTTIAIDDNTADNTLDEGRLWVDSNDNNRLWVFVDDGTPAFEGVTAVPQNGIILWDADETCPSGFTEVTAARTTTIRGTDIGAADATIPDTSGATGGSDALTIAQLAAHTHGVTVNAGVHSAGSAGISGHGTGGGATVAAAAQSTGSGSNHYHSFYTVLLCKKD